MERCETVNKQKKKTPLRFSVALCWRVGLYFAGILLLAIGLTLNTKTGLGVSPIIAVPFSIANIWGVNFALMTFCLYTLFVALQMLLNGKERRWSDLLQIPFSLLFSVLLDWFGQLPIAFYSLWQNLLLLLAAMILTAVGVSLMVNMKLVPNPADGMADALGRRLHRGMGFGKNLLDLTCVAVTCVISLVFSGRISAIGLGTLIALVCVGRLIALCQRLFQKPMLRRAGLLEPQVNGEEEERQRI
jgi:uncharacterized membrane protein YczE